MDEQPSPSSLLASSHSSRRTVVFDPSPQVEGQNVFHFFTGQLVFVYVRSGLQIGREHASKTHVESHPSNGSVLPSSHSSERPPEYFDIMPSPHFWHIQVGKTGRIVKSGAFYVVCRQQSNLGSFHASLDSSNCSNVLK